MMAAQPGNPAASLWANVNQYSDVIVALGIVAIVVIIIIPVPPFLLDLLLTFSISFALVIMLLTMFTTEALQFAVFPSLLLVTTLYRLSLNISSTRLILSQARAGNLIGAFGDFVVGGNYVVGFIIFVIITVIQFVVITNGSGRIAEVAARFTLDAMPGKQMSIDADFNAGIIDEETARSRRSKIQQEADFYGAMDGASKFVRGDAIAGVVIVLINIIGGLIIGVVQMGMPLEMAAETYTRLTVGDGLVSQVPALLVSSAAGMLVTRSTGELSFGADLSRQLFQVPKVLALTSGILLVLGIIPGLPFWPFFILSAACGLIAYILTAEQGAVREKEVQEVEEAQKKEEKALETPEKMLEQLKVEMLEIEIGYNLIPLTDESQGGDLLERITATRRQVAMELGIIVQPIRIRDNLQLEPNYYVIKIKGVEVARYSLIPGYFLALDSTGSQETLEGLATREPTFGLPATWIDQEQRDRADLLGFTVVDCSTVLITHLTEIIKSHAHELLGRQEVKMLVDQVKESYPAVVEELIPDKMGIGEVQKVLQNLLKEKVPIKDLLSIFETLADNAPVTRDPDLLTEYTRQALGRTICQQYVTADNRLFVITLDPRLENKLYESLQSSAQGSYPVLEPAAAQGIIRNVSALLEKAGQRGIFPVVLTNPRVRMPLRRLLERTLPDLAILSLNEIVSNISLESIGMVSLDEN